MTGSVQLNCGDHRATSESASDCARPWKVEDHGPKLSWFGPKSYVLSAQVAAFTSSIVAISSTSLMALASSPAQISPLP
jgi:hypothetical protein